MIESLLDLLEDNVDLEICYAIVLCIDKYIEPEFVDDCIEDALFEEYDALNEQYADKIKILPVMQKTGINTFSQLDIGDGYDLLRQKYPITREPLTEKIQNYIILEADMLSKNEIKLHRLKSKKTIGQKFLDKNSVSFAVFPVSCNPLEKYFNVKLEKGGFGIEGYKEEIVELEEKYLRMIKKCSEVSNIDFVIFPEMLMTDKIYESIHSKEHINAFIFNGTIWKNQKNVCIVTDGTGNKVFSYNKKSRFELELGNKTYMEDLKLVQNEERYDFLDIEGIGRIGVCICKDIMHNDIINMQKKMNTEILIVPAFSPSLDLVSSAKSFSEQSRCIVLIANACSAFYDRKKSSKDNYDNLCKRKIGSLVLPAKMLSERSEVVLDYFVKDCVSTCMTSDCMGQLFEIDFKDYTEKDGKKTMAYNIVTLS